MARIVVVGGGFAGCASAVRLAKLGHDVTLIEASSRLGGALGTTTHDGFTWQNGPTHTLLPAVIRDLYVKSGRKVEREFDLVPVDPQRHRFVDGTILDLPAGSRADQLHAVDTLGPGLGRAWVDWVGEYAEVWAVLRREWFEKPFDSLTASPSTNSLLASRQSLRRVANRLPDPRLRAIAVTESVLQGHRPSRTPFWWGLHHYLRQTFGVWTVPADQGGMAQIADSLARRLSTRRVSVVTDQPVTDVVLREGSAVAVRTTAAEYPADHVVIASDPRRIAGIARTSRRTRPIVGGTQVHLALVDPPPLPHETVLHGDPLIVLRTGGLAPEGHAAWTLSSPSPAKSVDTLLSVLARRGLDLRPHLVNTWPIGPEMRSFGSPWGIAWDGPGTMRRQLGPTTAIAGLHAVGAHARPGAGLAFVGLSAAQVAQVIGPATQPRRPAEMDSPPPA